MKVAKKFLIRLGQKESNLILSSNSRTVSDQIVYQFKIFVEYFEDNFKKANQFTLNQAYKKKKSLKISNFHR
jgi:hypothetical protein